MSTKPQDTEEFEHVWDKESQQWISRRTFAYYKKERLNNAQASIDKIECDLSRPMREVMLAVIRSETLPQAPCDKLQAADLEIVSIRESIAATSECSTQSDLDALEVMKR